MTTKPRIIGSRISGVALIRQQTLVFFGVFVFSLTLIEGNSAKSQDKIDFSHDIFPLLKMKCAACHSNGVYKGGLSLETREQLIESGNISKGNHLKSDLFSRITSEDPEEKMPPEGSRLTSAEIQKIATWIDAGLPWPLEITLKKQQFKRPLALRETNLPAKIDVKENPIDYFIDRYFQTNNIQPPPLLSDREFLRRAKLDLLGLLPTPAEVASYQNDGNPNKQSALIDSLLSQDRNYADHWMSFWNDLLRNDYVGTGYIDGGRKQITQWLHQSLLENKPYNKFVRELVNPSANSAGFIKGIKWRGRVNASQIEPLQFSQNISQVFLGINMKCASCHDSFIDDWRLEDAYGLAAITAQQPLEIHRCDIPTSQTATSKFVFPELGVIDHSQPREKRLEQLSQLMTTRENGRFARTIVNRLWHRMTGRGLVHPVDVMANEAWSEPLLDFLAEDLVKNKYNLKHVLHSIATSRIYQSQSAASESTDATGYVFRGVATKRMTAEQFVDSVWSLSGTAPNKLDAKIIPTSQIKTVGKWIWSTTPALSSPAQETVYFRKFFTLQSIPSDAYCIATCDNEFTLWVNGKRVSEGNNWTQPVTSDLSTYLKSGENSIIVKAVNQGDSPNPAGFFAEILFRNNSTTNWQTIHSNADWEFTAQPITADGLKQSGGPANWAAAKVIPGGWKTYAAVQPSIGSAKLNAEQSPHSKATTRASLVVSNLLMRSLGRPNREQVVTTRPDSLSTLQALDLSNGDILANWLKIGAKNWIEQQKNNRWTDQQLINEIYSQAFSRLPSDQELELLSIAKQENKTEAIEDVLWLVVMLPEFQLIN
ncbi:DUF1549 domain-containing protein [bacterium]|nr:DUF1549 domain-containing protein [bacterium]